MAYVNPNILAQIFGRDGTIDNLNDTKRQSMISQLSNAGGQMAQAAARPGAGFAESLGAGARGMVQGQQQAQQMQMNQMAIERAKAEQERQARIQKILGGGGGGEDDWSGSVDARRAPQPQPQSAGANMGPGIGQGGTQSFPMEPSAGASQWERTFMPLLNRVEQKESGGRQFNEQGGTLTSSAGAQGVMQIMPGTGPDAARMAGLPWDPDRMANDAQYNKALGAAYLNHLSERYDDDPVLASAAYNWGMGNVDKHIQRNGDPRKGEISHSDWVEAIGSSEAKDYAKTVGMPLLGQGGGAPPQPQQGRVPPQQGQLLAQMGGRRRQQPQGSGYERQPSAVEQMMQQLPPQVQQMVSVMEPDKALAFLSDIQKQQMAPANLSTGMSDLIHVYGQEGAKEQFRAERERELAGETGPVDQRDRKIRDYMGLYGLSRADSVRLADSIGQPEINPATGRLQGYDPISGEAFEVEVAPAGEATPAEVPETTLFDLTYESGTTGLSGAIAEIGGRVLGQGGFFSPGEESARNRQTLTTASRDLVRALQNNPRYAEGERKSIAEEVNIQPSAFDSPSSLRARMRSIHGSLTRRLAAEERISNNPGAGEKQRQAANQSASDIRRFLTQLGDPPPEDGRNEMVLPPDPEISAPSGWESDDWRWLTDEERQQILNARGGAQ